VQGLAAGEIPDQQEGAARVHIVGEGVGRHGTHLPRAAARGLVVQFQGLVRLQGPEDRFKHLRPLDGILHPALHPDRLLQGVEEGPVAGGHVGRGQPLQGLQLLLPEQGAALPQGEGRQPQGQTGFGGHVFIPGGPLGQLEDQHRRAPCPAAENPRPLGL